MAHPEEWLATAAGISLGTSSHSRHVALTVLSLLLERTAEHACGDTWRNIRDDLKGIKLAQLLSPHGAVWQVTDPAPPAAKRLKLLGMKQSSTPPQRDLAATYMGFLPRPHNALFRCMFCEVCR